MTHNEYTIIALLFLVLGNLQFIQANWARERLLRRAMWAVGFLWYTCAFVATFYSISLWLGSN